MTRKLNIYVQLLNEGTTCYRPTTAISTGGELYKLEPTVGYDPDDETWEFLPGSVVAIEERTLSSGTVKVAVSPKK